MKKFIFRIILLITGSLLRAQNIQVSKIFVIDPVGPDILSQPLKFGRQFKFKIIHVNDIKLTGYTTAKPFTFVTDAPTQFSYATTERLKTDTVVQAAKKLAKTIEATQNQVLVMMYQLSITKKASSKKTIAANKGKIAALEKEIANQKKQIDALKKVVTANDLQSNFQNNYNVFVTSYQKIQLYTGVEDTLYKMLPDVIIGNQEILVRNVKDYMTGIYDTADTTTFRKMVKSALNDINSSFVALKTTYQALNKIPETDTVNLDGQLKNKDGSVTISMSKVQGKIAIKPKFEDEFNSAVKIFNSLNSGNSQAVLYNKGVKGINLYQVIIYDKFTVYTDAQQLTDDELEVTPSLKNNAGTIVHQFNPVTIKAYGGLKVNFTTGYLLTSKGDDNYSYYYGGTPNAIAGVVKQKTNSLTNSIGALAHVYSRNPDGVSGGLSGGFSLTNNGNVGFYLGGSGLFLERNRLALTAGISFVKINTLNTGNLNLVDGVNKYNFNSTDTKINYDTLYRPGFFVGITYNIFISNNAVSSASSSNSSGVSAKAK